MAVKQTMKDLYTTPSLIYKDERFLTEKCLTFGAAVRRCG